MQIKVAGVRFRGRKLDQPCMVELGARVICGLRYCSLCYFQRNSRGHLYYNVVLNVFCAIDYVQVLQPSMHFLERNVDDVQES